VKWVALAIILAAVLPVSNWLRQNQRDAPKLWMLFGFLPFALSFTHLNMAIISWADWPGYVKGAEFSVLDALVLALYLSQPGPRRLVPFWLSMALYFTATLLSALQASEPTAALFYSWQVARMFLVYTTVARGCADPRVPPAILKGMAAGLFVEVAVTLVQRVGMGMLQAPGTMYHQNLLGMMTHFVALPAFALLLSGRTGRVLSAAVPAGIVIDVLTTSRGALGFSLLGYATIFIISSLRKWTVRKRTVLLIGVLGVLVIIPVAISSFDRRFSDQAELMSSDYDERAAFEKAAGMMLSDNPMGQGANHYVIAGNLGGYNKRAGVIAVEGSESANVHNVYYLVAAETGYLGLVTFVLLLLHPLIVALLCGWKNRGDQRGDLLIGLGVTLLIVYLHGLFEWIFVVLETQYMFAIDVGLVAGLATQLGYWSRTAPRTARLGADRLSIGPSGTAAGSLRSTKLDGRLSENR
jgi:O-antigen ligase